MTEKNDILEGPFDSLRDYLASVESSGRLIRIGRMDQDRYEATGFAYRLVDEYGFDDAPPFIIDQVRIGGKWMTGPVIGNVFGGWDNEARAFGVSSQELAETSDAYRAAYERLAKLYEGHSGWPRVAPIEVEAASAPCKQHRLVGDEVDLYVFPWLRTNPGDAGAYITAGTVFVEDPELGRNVATYRCQIKSRNRIGVNMETGQNAWSFLQKYKERGCESMPAAVVVGVDPITFAVGTSKMARLGEDELEIAGGLLGKPVELVRCETSSVRVPATAEIVIEGEISASDTEKEGPYGEVYGYMGLKKPSNYFMDVKAITYRESPLLVNAFAGITKLTMSLPQIVANNLGYRERIPNLIEYFRPIETIGVAILSIDKQNAGDGMAAGQVIADNDLFAKLIIVVDKDVDVRNKTQVFQAIGTRWQPHPASALIEKTKGFPLDPSAPTRWETSKMIVDATRQLPEEGGPENAPRISRELLEELSPETFELVNARWQEYWKQDPHS
ncbi:MAG: UbiD family decarboxylase [Gammaproteobacteria bacterium]|nr:UbiD family decarboxylase [Gammaproteobacteria bacterium]MBT8443265.1 UbiD family decarboxylase [Gammaproteobacteria bacterium]NND36526.1 UbiD family decarboxylase [Gammaproteobacteria bacterium]